MSLKIEANFDRASQELMIPFQVEGENGEISVVYYKLICTLCGGTFFKMALDNQKISCDNEKCDAIPLIVPQGLGEGMGMWKL